MNLESNLATSISLVAEVQMVHVFVQPSNRIVLELTFPTWADQQQKNKIKQLLQVLAG
jgi:hypothetical protein